LPIAQYPEITPPTVEGLGRVSRRQCPGGSPNIVAAPIEQEVNGVEKMLYMSSQCTNDGMYTLTVTFKHGVDLNMAQVPGTEPRLAGSASFAQSRAAPRRAGEEEVPPAC